MMKDQKISALRGGKKPTNRPFPLYPKRISSMSQSSCSDKFANFPCLSSKPAVEKELGVYMRSYSLKLQPAKKCLNFIADLRGRTFDIWMELERPEAHHQVTTVFYP